MRSVKSMIITELSILCPVNQKDITSFLFQAVEAKREETESAKGLTGAASRQSTTGTHSLLGIARGFEYRCPKPLDM